MPDFKREPIPAGVDQEQARREGGSGSYDWNSSLVGRTTAAGFSLAGLAADGTSAMGGNAITMGHADATRAALAAFAPTNEVEAMIAGQATAMHFAILEGLRRVAHPGEGFDGAAETWGAVAKVNRAMLDCIETLDRRRAAKTAPNVTAATSGETIP